MSIILAFLAMSLADRDVAAGNPHLLWIRENSNISTSAEVAAAVQRAAESTRSTVVLNIPDLRDPGNLRHFYIAAGDSSGPGAEWAESGYPDFSPAMRTEVHDFSELSLADPRGYYMVFGEEEDAHAVQDALSDVGLVGDFAHRDDERVLHREDYLLEGDLFNALVTTALCIVVVVGSGVLLNAKAYGVMRLNGHSYLRILGSDLFRIACVWVVAALVTTVLALTLLGLYNGWAQLREFAALTGYVVAGLTAAAVGAHALALGMLHLSDVLGTLKGKLPVRSTVLATYTVRITVLVLAFGAIGALAGSAREVRVSQEGFDHFVEADDTSQITFLGSVRAEEMEEAFETDIGPWLRETDTDGDTILVRPGQADYYVPPGSPYPDFEALLVNDTYLRHQELLSPDGERYGPGESVRILIPESHADLAPTLLEGVEAWLDFEMRDDEPVDIEVLALAGGQQVFTYGRTEQATLTATPLLTDAVIVVIPNGMMPAPRYAHLASQGYLLFPDPTDVETAIAQEPLSSYVNGLQPVALAAADQHDRLLSEVRIRTANLAALGVVVALTGLAACLIYVRTRAQQIFARHINGWTFTAAHRGMLLAEACVMAGFVGWATWWTLNRLALLQNPQTFSPEVTGTTGTEPFMAAGVAGVALIFVLATLAFFHRRIVHEGATQA
ncbi:hypothetical protein [Nocardiopsis algeriensis]|uniref:FtsX-like permease family protein n=1 Tax=Nocardiopsis algeriensis TaxID=1478215 RepID=A0A841IIP6_9ACTN|nr:hypothetical protein [Nocardiopsis algeriensis]MBB6118543.1 hypothetical protein [Nocardiopsis algeriensis]